MGFDFENFDEKEKQIANFILQEIKDTIEGGLTSRNFASSRNTIIFNESDSLDSDYPFIMDFAVLPETIKIAKVEVSFKIKKFRAYSKAAASGGGSTPTSSDGGGQTSSSVITPSGGSGTSGVVGDSASAALCHAHIIGILGEGSGKTLLVDTSGNIRTAEADPPDSATYDNSVSLDHTHTTPNHTHPTHSHTVVNHNHTVTIANHAHDITYGIYEEDTSPTIHFWISEDDGGIWKAKHGGYTEDQANLDITSYLTLGNGEKMLKFTSDVRCRISARVLLKLDIKAR